MDEQSSALLDQADHYRSMGRYDRARELAGQVLTRHPDDVEALCALGWVEFGAENTEQALALFGRACALNPDHLEALTSYAQACESVGRPQDGLPAAQRAAALEPEHPRVLCVLAEVLGRKHLREAYAVLDHAERLAPGDPEIYRVRALLLNSSFRWRKARTAARDWVAADVDNAYALIYLAYTESRLFNVPQGIRAVFAAVRQRPQTATLAQDLLSSLAQRLVVMIMLVLIVTTVILYAGSPSGRDGGAPPESIRQAGPRVTMETTVLPGRPAPIDPDTPLTLRLPAPERTVVTPRIESRPAAATEDPAPSSIPAVPRLIGAGLLLLVVAVFAAAVRAVPSGGRAAMRSALRRAKIRFLWPATVLAAFGADLFGVLTGSYSLEPLAIVPVMVTAAYYFWAVVGVVVRFPFQARGR
ncbi:MAG: tetratricopeptide repeat protein [Gordonia sp. (in: high G+C Gram-positive bacteria)]|uniref:tetratricopeptide repeat protein n=1 Tax=Gordonia sp. (in: high G+C Gram-positive bacteria) TaxID=84139 RepID=UPI0039E44C69